MLIITTLEKKYYAEIEIDLPYYYKHDLLSDHADIIIYGKIADENTVISITEKSSLCAEGADEYEIEKKKFGKNFHCYLKKEYKGTEKEYEEVRARLQEFIKKHS